MRPACSLHSEFQTNQDCIGRFCLKRRIVISATNIALRSPQGQGKAYITKVIQGIELSFRKQVTSSPNSVCGGVGLCLENPKALLIPIKELSEIEALIQKLE